MTNKVTIAILIGVALVVGTSYLALRNQPNTPTVDVGNSPNLQSLDKAEHFEDLGKYGLVSPDAHNHKAGSNLIMLGLKANAFGKGDWVMAHGLLGVSMLDVDVIDGIAYRSLFLPYAFIHTFKMNASHLINNNALLMEVNGVPKSSKSIIARREAAIYTMSHHLNGRYVYNREGNFGRNYSPEPNRKSNEQLMQTLEAGLKIVAELEGMGFDDKTLKDTLGIGYASLEYDHVDLRDPNIYKLGPLQVYRDTLNATLTKLRENRDHSYEVLYQLGWEMQARGLAADDKMFLPKDQNNFEAMLKVVESDLAAIKRSTP
jgi:hypothetical protein